jgi:hypothetical protein
MLTITQEIKWGKSIMDCAAFLNNLILISANIIAREIDDTVPNPMKTILYKTVFLVIVHAFPLRKINLKLARPFQGLKNIPSLKLYFLKAIMVPIMGIYENTMKYRTAGINIIKRPLYFFK